MKVSVGLACLIVALGATARQPREYVLDLTAPGVVATPLPAVSIEGGGSTVRSLPLRLRLRSLDRSEYRPGEEATYEVALTNTSPSPVSLPWSVDLEAAYAGGAPPIRGFLALSLSEGDPIDTRLAAVMLAGSGALPGSILSLGPGRTAVIRVRRHTDMDSSAARRVVAGRPLELRAVFTLQTAEKVIWQPVFSENHLPVIFRPWGVANEGV